MTNATAPHAPAGRPGGREATCVSASSPTSTTPTTSTASTPRTCSSSRSWSASATTAPGWRRATSTPGGRTCRARSRSTARPRRSPRRSRSAPRSCRSSSMTRCASPRRCRCSTTSRGADCSSVSARACPRPATTCSPAGATSATTTTSARSSSCTGRCSGEQVPDSQARIHPPNHDLRGRIYHGTSTWSTIRRAAQLGDGFILERFGNGDERTPENRPAFQKRQADSILEYRSEFARAVGHRPHAARRAVALGVAGRDAPSEALREVTDATREWNDFARSVGRLPEGLTPGRRAASPTTSPGERWTTSSPTSRPTRRSRSRTSSCSGCTPGDTRCPSRSRRPGSSSSDAYPLLDAEWRRARATLATAWPRTTPPAPPSPPDRRHPRERNTMTLATPRRPPDDPRTARERPLARRRRRARHRVAAAHALAGRRVPRLRRRPGRLGRPRRPGGRARTLARAGCRLRRGRAGAGRGRALRASAAARDRPRRRARAAGLRPRRPGRGTRLRGIHSFPRDDGWVLSGAFVPAADGRTTRRPQRRRLRARGAGGRNHRARRSRAPRSRLTVSGGPKGLSAVVADGTSGVDAYRFRFLPIDPPDADGSVSSTSTARTCRRARSATSTSARFRRRATDSPCAWRRGSGCPSVHATRAAAPTQTDNAATHVGKRFVAVPRGIHSLTASPAPPRNLAHLDRTPIAVPPPAPDPSSTRRAHRGVAPR